MNGLGDARLTLSRHELANTSPVHLTGRTPASGEKVSRWVSFWQRLHTRRALLRLTDEQLRDVGLTRDEANREALRPFWTL